MTKEFCLSDRILNREFTDGVIPTGFVKEFIKRLKKSQCNCKTTTKPKCRFCKKVEQLAGEKLIWKNKLRLSEGKRNEKR